jgi:hypothetical protein
VDKPLPKLITRGDILFRSTFLPGSNLFLPTYMQLQANHSNLASAESQTMTALGLLAAFWIYNIIDAGAITQLSKQELFSFGVVLRSTPISEQNGITRSVEQYGFLNYTWRF